MLWWGRPGRLCHGVAQARAGERVCGPGSANLGRGRRMRWRRTPRGMQTLFVTMQPGFDLAIPRTPTLRPFAAPWPALVAVSDTNTLATQACNVVRAGLHNR
jgi:hypothetical protein